jgi:hypothetical protein
VDYAVDNSCRFNDGSSDTLSKTFGSASSSNTTFTVSAWVKRAKLSANQDVVSAFQSSSGLQTDLIRFGSADDLEFYAHTTNASGNADIQTNRLFRDVGAWYHIVLALDTTQATASNRVKIYVNGVQETSFSTESYMNQNGTIIWGLGSGTEHTIGAVGTSNYFGGYVAEVCYIDGSQLDPTSFGEFDEDSGIWKPKSVSGLTFGTNGFYLDFEDSAALGDDVSGNGNDFTVNNLTAIDQTTDTPTNNFATMNPLAVPPSNAPTFAEGNTKVSTNTTNANPVLSSMGVSQDKWYVEAKRISYDGGTGDDDGFRIGFGATYVQDVNLVPPGIVDSGHYFMIGNGTVYNGSTDLGVLGGNSNISDNGVQQIALDLDNNRITWGFNGLWMDGSGAYNQSSPSNYVTIASGYTYFFLQTDGSSGRAYTAGWNFGGASAFTISSGNSDANGYGNFEYAVPSGYYALNTKNLAEYG